MYDYRSSHINLTQNVQVKLEKIYCDTQGRFEGNLLNVLGRLISNAPKTIDNDSIQHLDQFSTLDHHDNYIDL